MADIERVAETARWVALYRAMETERPDALFNDPHARRLAGEWDEQKLRRIPQGNAIARPLIVRTVVIDEILGRLLREEGVDLVLNLAAGLDARPYRLPLDSGLRWVEVDLPETIDYKESVLRDAEPRCQLERVGMDLRDADERRSLFNRLGAESDRALVLTEGLLIYLAPEEVASLASDLGVPASFRFWITDLASPLLLQWMNKSWSKTMGANVAFRFAPEAGASYFADFGWAEKESVFLAEEGRRLRREMPMAFLWRFLSHFVSSEKRESYRRLTSVALLERADDART